MDYIIWGLIAVQVALIAYQTYVYKKLKKGTRVKWWQFFTGNGVVVLQFTIAAIVIILHFLK